MVSTEFLELIIRLEQKILRLKKKILMMNMTEDTKGMLK